MPGCFCGDCCARRGFHKMCCLIKSSFPTEFAWRRFEINYAAVCGVTKHLEFKDQRVLKINECIACRVLWLRIIWSDPPNSMFTSFFVTLWSSKPWWSAREKRCRSTLSRWLQEIWWRWKEETGSLPTSASSPHMAARWATGTDRFMMTDIQR